jgi:hypothetical protein
MWQSQSVNSRSSGGGGAVAGGMTPTQYASYGRKGSSPAAGYLADEGDSTYSMCQLPFYSGWLTER